MQRAALWASGQGASAAPGTLGDREGLIAFADAADTGLLNEVHTVLSAFGVRVGARRAADAAWALDLVGAVEAARIASDRARIIGGMQGPLVMGEPIGPALRQLAATCVPFADALARTARLV